MSGRWTLVPHVLFFLAIAVAQVNETLGGLILLLVIGMALGLIWKSAGARGLLLIGLAGLVLAALVALTVTHPLGAAVTLLVALPVGTVLAFRLIRR